MTRDFITLVCGFGRCGSSLVMQMLHAGGMPCVGKFPAFEDEHTLDEIPPKWMVENVGKAMKLLDPQRVKPPHGFSYKAVWLNRGYIQQARSQVKFLKILSGLGKESDVPKLVASYKRDKPLAMTTLAAIGAEVIQLSFEDILVFPRTAAFKLSKLVGDLDIDAMVDAVVPRPPECAVGLDMEMALIEKWGDK